MAETVPFSVQKADDSPGFLLWKITALWQRTLTEVLSNLGITQTQYALLASVCWLELKKEHVSQAGLIDHTKIDKMTVSKAIRKIETMGLLIRKPSCLDSRTSDVRLTVLGKKLTHHAIEAVESADHLFFSGLKGERLKHYKELTLALITHNES